MAAIDETTLLVPISLVLFRSSFIVDARAIVEKAHRVGAHVILDVFQATGTLPFDVRELGVDFAVGGVLKWLCGGPGVAYLYVREDLRAKLKPALTGWIAHQRPFAFETGAIDSREDSFRYLNGTPHIPALFACQPGLEILNKAGVEAIRAKSIAMTTRLMEGAKARGWRVNTPENAAERAGTVSVDCPHAYEVSRELLAREIMIDFRPKAGIRLVAAFLQSNARVRFRAGADRRDFEDECVGETRARRRRRREASRHRSLKVERKKKDNAETQRARRSAESLIKDWRLKPWRAAPKPVSARRHSLKPRDWKQHGRR